MVQKSVKSGTKCLIYLGFTLIFNIELFLKGLTMSKVTPSVDWPSASPAPEGNLHSQPDLVRSVAEATGIAMDVFGLPFDVARAQYARAVQVGLIERSMLASRDFSRVLSSVEKLTLGPWARHV
jgi:hypothetical protein